ncbi:MAG: hypothetical protein Q4F12_00190 [Erysipelotrichaceae bacterium]|nr:hypothetical protein [Erysipelotrichaceae bacterium]
MKKIITLLIVLLVLCGCKQEELHVIVDYEYSNMGIIVPTGAPALAFLNSIDDPTFETNSNPKNIVAMMNSNSDKRIIVLDTVTGINAIKKGAPYKLAFNITFGNYYLAATGNDDNVSLDDNDNVVVFGDTGSSLFDYLFEGIKVNKEIVPSVSDAAKCLAMGKNLESDNIVDYVLVAEPVLSSTLNNKELPTYGKSYVYADIQDLYREKTNKELIQASIFIKDDNYIQDFNDYLYYMETNIDNVLNNNTYVEDILKNHDNEVIKNTFGLSKEMITNVLKTNSINLGFKKAIDNKDNIDYFLSILNMEGTNEEIYYQ